MLEPRDNHYFNDCIADLRQLMYPIIVRRAVLKKREGSSTPYPDDPIKPTRCDIHTRADYAGVTASEVERSGGTILGGDLKIWTVFELVGPEKYKNTAPEGLADIVVLQGHEFVVIGFPDHSELSEGVYPGFSALIRRRATSFGKS